jgi:hypothetical protein
MFFLKDEYILILVKKIFYWNGLILFYFKLICAYILITRYYLFYLEFKDVYLSFENDPRNEILSEYKKMRKIFIIKIFFNCFAGFIIISMELIILTLVMTFNSIYKETETIEISIKEKQEIKKEKKGNELKKSNSLGVVDKPVQGSVNSQKNGEQNINNSINKGNEKFILRGGESSLKEGLNPFIPLINLTFQIKQNEDDDIKNYELQVDKKEQFNVIEKRLKEEYPELKDFEMVTFRIDADIINKDNTVEQNNIKGDTIILVNM